MNPEALVWERDRFTHQGPIRGGQNIRRVGEARGQIRVGPDHGPEPRALRLCPRLGEGRVEYLLARSLSARGWEADRCVHTPCHQARDHSELMIPGKHECKGLVCGWARLVGP